MASVTLQQVQKHFGDNHVVRDLDLSIADGESLIAEPVDIIRLFHVAQRHDLDIHPSALRLITKNLRLIDGALKKDPRPTACSLRS